MSSGHLPTDTRIFVKECQSLVRSGFDVSLVVPGTEDKVVEGVKLVGVKRRENRWRRFTQTAFDVYKKAEQLDADIYHFHDPDLIPYAILLKRKGKKVIYDVHEDFPRQTMGREYIPKFLRKPISNAIEVAENNVVNKFDALVTATPTISARMSEIHDKVVEVNNYPIMSEFHDAGEDRFKKSKSVCYVGLIAPNRGINEMVRAIGMTECHLELVGAVPNSKSHLTFEKGVRSHGHLNRKKVDDIFSKSIAGLVLLHPEPGYVESQPTKLYEYWSAGLPVIASNFPKWKDVIEKYNCGICVDPTNAKAISKAISWLHENPQKAFEMGQAGKEIVRKKFNWQNEEMKLIGLYDKLLNS